MIPKPTPCESIVEHTLKAVGVRYVREKEYRHPQIGPFFVDFYIPGLRLVLEVDGASHDLEEARFIDRMRDRFHHSSGRRTCRIRNHELLEATSPTDIVIDHLLQHGFLKFLRDRALPPEKVERVRHARGPAYAQERLESIHRCIRRSWDDVDALASEGYRWIWSPLYMLSYSRSVRVLSSTSNPEASSF